MTRRLAIGAFAAAAMFLAAGAATAAPERYVLDPMHTFVNFEVLHFGTSTVRGRFDRSEGQVVIDPVARARRSSPAIVSSSTGIACAPWRAR
jgi:polyisoprenoid-binding protein YceI